MTSIGPNTQPAWRDPRDRVALSHPLEAAALLLLGHAPAYIEGHPSGRPIFVYPREVAADLQRVRRAVEEVLALAERHKQLRRHQQRPTNLRLGDTHDQQQPR